MRYYQAISHFISVLRKEYINKLKDNIGSKVFFSCNSIYNYFGKYNIITKKLFYTFKL